MSVYWDEKRKRFRWQFKATVDGQRYRLSKQLPASWGEAQAKKYDETETARTYTRIASGKRVSTVPLIDIAVDLYLRERVPNLKDGKNAALNLAHLLPEFQGKGLDQLGKIARHYAKIKAAELKPATIRQRLATLRSAATYALKYHGVGSQDWIAQMPMPSVKNERHHYKRRSEVLRLARACKHLPTRALILMTFATGSRPGELHRADVLEDCFLMPETKNGERSIVPVLRRFQYLLRHWPLELDYTRYSYYFRQARDACGFEGLHLHDLRHSTASALASEGVSLFQVGQVLNHKTAQATKRYAHLYPELKADILKQIWQKTPHKKKA